MPGTLTPGQVFDHDLNVLKGWRNTSNLDKSAEPGANVTGIVRGKVMYLDAAGAWALGVTPNGMSVFATGGQNDFDANGDVGNIQKNVVTGLVAIGAYELQSSEYVDAVYAPNDTLTADATGDLTAGTPYVDQLCGVVSDGVVTNSNNVSVLTFWGVWLPPAGN